MFYNSFSTICEHFGESPTTVLRNVGISPSSYQNWKVGGKATNPTKQKIANYFNISVDELNDGKLKKPPTESEGLTARQIKFLSIIEQLPPDKLELVESLAAKLLKMQ